jgi:hypothetical protein
MIPDLLKIANDLAQSFGRIQEGESLAVEAGVSPQRYVATYGLAAHANDLAIDTLDLIRRHRFDSAIPLTRLIFECAMHCQWLATNPLAHSALLTADEIHRKNLNNTLKASASFKHLFIAESATAEPATPGAPRSSLESICKALNDGDESLYVIYRSLSGGGHSGVSLIERWIEEISDPPGVGFRIKPSVQPYQFNQLAGTVAISLLWTNAAFDCMTRLQPLEAEIASSSLLLETKPLLGAGKLVLSI